MESRLHHQGRFHGTSGIYHAPPACVVLWVFLRLVLEQERVPVLEQELVLEQEPVLERVPVLEQGSGCCRHRK